MSILKYGSAGDGVKELQKKLNAQGYSLSEDGNFGLQTRAAVRDYQSKNGLTVDGIVGSETQGSLTEKSTARPVTTDSPVAGTLAPSQTAAQAQNTTNSTAGSQNTSEVDAALESLSRQTAKPGTYTSQYDQQIQDIYDQIVGRKEFSYDLNQDPYWNQYQELYQRLGKQAMTDTMGRAAGLTGGYGSSYAQAVGQQAYDSYLQDLNEMAPEFVELAQGRYDAETEKLYDLYSMLQNKEAQDYSRWQDQYNSWLTEEQLRQDQENWQAEMDLSKEQWDAEMDLSKEQWDAEMELAREQWEWQKAQAEQAASSGSGYYYSSGSSNSKNDTTEQTQDASSTTDRASYGTSLIDSNLGGIDRIQSNLEQRQGWNYGDAAAQLYAQGVNPYDNSAAVISWAAKAGYTPAQATELVELYKQYWYDVTGTKSSKSGTGGGKGATDVHYVLGM